MNPLAIRLYQMHGHDLTASPLKFTLNNQHLNGGIEVDIWARTSLTGCYAAGENAGTHGVTRQVEQRSMPGKFSPAAVHYILLIRKARTGLSRGNKFSVRLMRRNST